MAENKQNKRPNVPPLRFPEFSEPWERKKLSNFTERVTRKNKGQTNLPLTISAQYGLVDQISFFNNKVASADMSNYYLLKRGEFTYNKSYSSDYPLGAVKRLDLYDMGALSTLYICFKIVGDINSDYLVHYFESPKWHRGVYEIAGEGARNHGLLNIAVGDYFETQHYLPCSLKEQEKIASMLNLIQRRIEVQNKLIEQLESLIKGICHDFHNHIKGWLQVSFSELGTDYGGLSNKTAADFGEGKPFITYLNVYTNRIVNENHVQFVNVTDDENQNKVKWGDVLFTLSSETPDEVAVGSVYLGNNNELYLNSFCFGIHIDNEQLVFQPYLAYLISSPQFRKWVFPLAQGSTRFNLHKADFMKKKFLLPPLEEQKKLYQCLNSISRRIVFETSILDDLQELKQSLLQQMFI